jgi:NADPH-dependent glutamate synthase beta subunit-like oxidoreductase
MKGAQVVVEGAGDFAFEYITSGTGLVLGPVGPGFCNSALGGIVIAHKDAAVENFSSAVRIASPEESQAYEVAVMTMLQLHVQHTGSAKAARLLNPFVPTDFNVLIPKELDKYNTPKHLIDVLATYKLRQVPITCGMEVWLRQKVMSIFTEENVFTLSSAELGELRQLKDDKLLAPLFSPNILKYMRQRQSFLMEMNYKKLQGSQDGESNEEAQSELVTKLATPVEDRLRTITGELDERYLDAIKNIRRYVTQLHRDAEGCSGCRAQSCSGGENVDFGCPGGKSINTINSFLKRLGNISENGILTSRQWTFLRQAFDVQIESSPFIAYTGAACPAPCQDACTETIPDRDAVNSKDKTRRGKLFSEAVHIKDIEFHLYQVGRAMGWFDGKKVWNSGEIPSLFGTDMTNLTNYYSAMAEFQPVFRKRTNQPGRGNELIVVGSGPAGMQLAFEALRDGMRVSMFERSDKPGGLLSDGIPAHKFDKVYLQEDFDRLVDMGLELYLNSEVQCDPTSGEYFCTTISSESSDPQRKQARNRRVIASSSNKQQYVALCIGAGNPRSLPPQVTEGVDPKRLVSASEFLKATNDLATTLARETDMPQEERELLIKKRLGYMDPRGKKIVVVGGGDTAQDVLRWVSRYFNEERSKGNYSSKLMQLVRGPKVGQRGIKDGYPALSQAPTKENLLLAEEIEYIQGDMKHLIEPTRIGLNEKGLLEVDVKQSSFKYQQHIEKNNEMMQLARALPRELRPVDPHSVEYTVHDVDFVICALGNLGKNSVDLVRDAEAAAAAHGNNRLFFAGDIAGVEEKIIIGAQTNASAVYGQIRAKFMKNSDGTDYARGSY